MMALVHQRYFKYVPRSGYAKRLVQAHKLHHATIGKEGGVSFGFVFARDPAKLKAELKVQREAGIAVVREALRCNSAYGITVALSLSVPRRCEASTGSLARRASTSSTRVQNQ